MLPKEQSQIPAMHSLFTILLLYLFSSSHQQVCNPSDQSSLLAFSANIVATPSPPLNWSSTTNCCQWEGVDCDTNGRVTHLSLPSKGLKGVISSSIGNLVNLTHLDLSTNHLHGHIPLEVGNLLHLESLFLQNNSISGPIPLTLMNCTNIIDIILRFNHLNGDISELNFSRLVHLQKLDLMDNNLSGKLPKSIYLCKSLTALRVSGNNLIGQVSPKIVKLKSLSFLSYSQHSYTSISRMLSILARCENLTVLILADMNFHGDSLPSNRNFLGSPGFPKIEFLSLIGCNLTGTFPEWIANLKTLRALLLQINKIRGEIPKWIGTLPNLFSLELGENLLSGEIPPSLCQLPALVSKTIDQNFNHLNLELPVYAGGSPGGYQEYSIYYPSTLMLADNKLSGHIPSEIGKLQNLQHLNLKNNSFSGHIPLSLCNLKKLERLSLSENNLTGRIPLPLVNLHFLASFDVSYNNLEGPIPTGGQFSALDKSNFEGNSRLCGEILDRRCSSIATSTPIVKDHPLKGRSESKQSFLDGLWVGFASGFSGVLVVATSYFWFNIYMGRSPFLATA